MILRLLMVFILSLACVVALNTTAVGGDSLSWLQWRGPNRDGKSPDQGLLQEWSDEGPPLVWRADGIGVGYSSVSICREQAYTMGDVEGRQYAVALHVKNGEIVWRTDLGAANSNSFPGTRSTPTVDGEHLYLMTTAGVLVCLDVTTGEENWRKDLVEEFGAVVGLAQGAYQWEFSESPLVDGNQVIVTPGTRDAAVVALNKNNGELIWQTATPELGGQGVDGAGYSSVVISHGSGIKQYVQLIGRGLIGVEAKTGRFLWGYNRIANDVANIPTPIVHKDYVFASTGYQTGAVLLELHQEGDGIRPEEVYFVNHRTMQNTHGGMVLHDGYIYTGTGQNKGLPLCLKFDTGEVKWGPLRNKGIGSAAIAYADGRLYLRYEEGLMVLAEPTPEGYREHGTFVIPDADVRGWSHPVIISGHLYVREQDNLFCYDLRASNKTGGQATTND